MSHALIRHGVAGADAEILAIGDERSMLARHAELLETLEPRTFASVRPVDHELTAMAARAMAAALSSKQRETLVAIDRWLTAFPWQRSVRPGYERGWVGPYPTDMVRPASRMPQLVRVDGVPYGPKTYRLTAIGRRVAEEAATITGA